MLPQADDEKGLTVHSQTIMKQEAIARSHVQKVAVTIIKPGGRVVERYVVKLKVCSSLQRIFKMPAHHLCILEAEHQTLSVLLGPSFCPQGKASGFRRGFPGLPAEAAVCGLLHASAPSRLEELLL